ncbi:MAG: PfkB family carbohydrate kinase [Candidatus Marinimicrobia bacterium]|nr:PfkB family carbohydrate kinase [Candidatus Neomarinimicrobiota bacterium]
MKRCIRTDREQRVAVSPDTEQKLESAMRRTLPSADACILQDYNKGVLTPELIKATLSEARKLNIPVFVDPKFENLEQYAGTFLIKPNLHEAEYILKRRIRGMEAAKNAAETLFSILSPRHILLTMGADGMILKDAGRLLHIPAQRIEKADITGAGDTVIAALAAFYCSGLNMKESAEKANLAAAEVCAHPGVSTVTRQTLSRDR